MTEDTMRDGQRAVVLVADDDPMMRLLASKALQNEGFHVMEAENGEEALAQFARLTPDIVMLDVVMPVMDGFIACTELRKLPEGRLVPVLMATGLDDVESIRRAYEAGATDFVTKPINWLVLGHRVRYMLRASRSIEAFRRSEAKNRALLDAVPDMMLRISGKGDLLEFKQARDFRPFALDDEHTGRKILEVLPIEVASVIASSVEKALGTSQTQVLEHRFVEKGMTCDCESRIVKSGEDEALAILRDITERKKAEKALRESEERYALASKGANDGLWDWDLRTNEIHFSARWKEMLGLDESEMGNSPDEWFTRIHPDDVDRVRLSLNAHLEGRSPHFEIEHRLLHRDGTYLWMLTRGMAVRDRKDLPYRMAGSQTDITEGKKISEQLQRDAFYDPLTKLPNRALFMDRLGHAVARGKRVKDHIFGVLFFDLDRFKLINDSLGHLTGDELLVQVADRIGRFVRPGDTFARLAGDEFVILLEDVKDPNCTTFVAERIKNLFSQPFTVGGREVFVTASTGVAMGTCAYDRPEELLRDADIAMYRAKSEERGSCVVFDPSMHRSTVELLELENDLRKGLERQEFRMYYQPIVDLETGNLSSMEALVRWMHPVRGLVPPSAFIHVAEETGIIIPLGEWILETVCRQVRAWHEQGSDIRVAVNLSVRQLRDKGLPDLVAGILARTGVPARSIDLEITESAVIDNWDLVGTTIAQLKELGVHLCLDDFGTGYSSLSYLHRLPVTKLKIDRSFLERMTGSSEHSGIVQTILDLAKRLEMDVVAEGIETKGQLDQLIEMKCQLGQGYLFARPLDKESATALILDQVPLLCVPGELQEGVGT